jgi:hypothetical protein
VEERFGDAPRWCVVVVVSVVAGVEREKSGMVAVLFGNCLYWLMRF